MPRAFNSGPQFDRRHRLRVQARATYYQREQREKCDVE
jgi:hypothetical protein